MDSKSTEKNEIFDNAQNETANKEIDYEALKLKIIEEFVAEAFPKDDENDRLTEDLYNKAMSEDYIVKYESFEKFVYAVFPESKYSGGRNVPTNKLGRLSKICELLDIDHTIFKRENPLAKEKYLMTEAVSELFDNLIHFADNKYSDLVRHKNRPDIAKKIDEKDLVLIYNLLINAFISIKLKFETAKIEIDKYVNKTNSPELLSNYVKLSDLTIIAVEYLKQSYNFSKAEWDMFLQNFEFDLQKKFRPFFINKCEEQIVQYIKKEKRYDADIEFIKLEKTAKKLRYNPRAKIAMSDIVNLSMYLKGKRYEYRVASYPLRNRFMGKGKALKTACKSIYFPLASYRKNAKTSSEARVFQKSYNHHSSEKCKTQYLFLRKKVRHKKTQKKGNKRYKSYFSFPKKNRTHYIRLRKRVHSKSLSLN